MKLFLRLLQYIKPYSAYLIGALACIIVLAATTALTAFLVKPAIDGIFIKNTSIISLSDVRNPKTVDQLLFEATDRVEARIIRAAVPAENMQQIQSAVAKPKNLIERARAFITSLTAKKLRKKYETGSAPVAVPALTRPRPCRLLLWPLSMNCLLMNNSISNIRTHITVPESGPAFSARENLTASGLLP